MTEQPLTAEQLVDIEAARATYRASHDHPGAFACCSAHAAADTVPALLAEVHRLTAALAEMTHCRDQAFRALNRDDVVTDPHLPDLFADGLYGLYEWEDQPEPDQAPQALVDRCVQIVQPAFGKLTQQRDKARARIGELEARNTRTWRQRAEAAEARVAELERERAKYVGAEPTIAEEMAELSRRIDTVLDLCDEQDKAARLFELPTPEWITAVRQAAEGTEAGETR